MRRIVFAAFFLILATTAQAAETKPVSLPPTRIETDQKAGLIRFIVDGHEQAVLDATGFHVKDDLTYNGGLIDGPTPSDYDPPRPATGKPKP